MTSHTSCVDQPAKVSRLAFFALLSDGYTSPMAGELQRHLQYLPRYWEVSDKERAFITAFFGESKHRKGPPESRAEVFVQDVAHIPEGEQERLAMILREKAESMDGKRVLLDLTALPEAVSPDRPPVFVSACYGGLGQHVERSMRELIATPDENRSGEAPK